MLDLTQQLRELIRLYNNHQKILIYDHTAFYFKRLFHIFDQLHNLIRMQLETLGVDLPNLINQLLKIDIFVAEITHQLNLFQ